VGGVCRENCKTAIFFPAFLWLSFEQLERFPAFGGNNRLQTFWESKRPGLILSRGANVDQPSPKCCSVRRIDQFPTAVNGYWELRWGTNGLRSELRT
jgi:hypothetical protein